MNLANLDLLFPVRRRSTDSYTSLRPDLILATLDKLEQRIAARFPDSGLRRVCAEFKLLASDADRLALRLREPIWLVRLGAIAAGALLVGLVAWALVQVTSQFTFHPNGVPDLLQATEAAINELIFLGLALFTLMGLEAGLKRRAALKTLHQLRSIAHVVDMHQLTKDPAWILSQLKRTDVSPERTLDRPLLTRYLDYCSEILALIAKIAALFGQNSDDPIVLNAVNDIEALAQGLSAKIWQKIMILDLAEEPADAPAGPPAA
ncbi:MAG: hypothetical protein SF053_21970 [Bacteroidia bacterium]|nr:hypothetical protein [Bacteroidia bacterium]